MTTTALLIGLSTDISAELRARLARVGVTARSFRHAEDVGMTLDQDTGVFAMVPFMSAVEFGAELSELSILGLERAVVAVLPKASYEHCTAAFRSGAHDVIARPFAEEDLGRLVEGMQGAHRKGGSPGDVIPLADMERRAIIKALSACNGQVSMTARKLGIGRSTLYRKLELYRIGSFRDGDESGAGDEQARACG